MKKVRIVFVNYQLICGGAEQALFDLINLLDKEKFEASVFVQHEGGDWEGKFRNAGIPVIYDYSCRKPTLNPVIKESGEKAAHQTCIKPGGERTAGCLLAGRRRYCGILFGVVQGLDCVC